MESIRIEASGTRTFWDVVKEKIGITNRTWQNLPLQNGATDGSDGGNLDGYTPSYHKDALGFVHLRGMVGYDTATNGQVVATLPVGFRPSRHLFFTLKEYSLDVRPNGEIIISESNPGSGIARIPIEFVPPFMAEQ